MIGGHLGAFRSSRQLELWDWILPHLVLSHCVNCKIYPHGSLQDFISISFLEIGAQSRTLASRNDTTAEQLSQQCAEKFEVSHPKDYALFVYVDDQWLQLDKDALPHHIKASLLKSETKKDFHFIYKPIDQKTPPVPIVKESDFPKGPWCSFVVFAVILEELDSLSHEILQTSKVSGTWPLT